MTASGSTQNPSSTPGIVTSSGTPTIVGGPGGGSSPTVQITGIDSSGQILIVPDVGASLADLAVITFANPFPGSIDVTLTPANANAGLIDYLVDNMSGSGFGIAVASVPAVGLPGLALLFNYLVIGHA